MFMKKAKYFKCSCFICMHAQSCLTLCNSLDYSVPGSPVHGILQQEYWSELPFLPPGNILDPGIKPASPVAPALQVDSSLLSHRRSPLPQFN